MSFSVINVHDIPFDTLSEAEIAEIPRLADFLGARLCYADLNTHGHKLDKLPKLVQEGFAVDYTCSNCSAVVRWTGGCMYFLMAGPVICPSRQGGAV